MPCTTDVTNGAHAADSSFVAHEGHAIETARAHAAGELGSPRSLHHAYCWNRTCLLQLSDLSHRSIYYKNGQDCGSLSLTKLKAGQWLDQEAARIYVAFSLRNDAHVA